ncbi:hypothetical protein QBC35DRAFT_491414 [Podospora australis]|uniref:DUF4045 domain-containing protein n=1 Tax=Podospora australis TaxID=1536484 RepID=A0AAN7ALS6_9PEZI|nr:hypothetical protein QBC35DRAFT_491414 [Podospora australis]
MSDEVSDFLRSVELLKGKREEEDEARSRELEEKIMQEKEERRARRAERARSISPQKSSPANTPSPAAHRIGLPSTASDGISLPAFDFERSGSPLPRAVSSLDTMDTAADYSSSPTKENEAPFDSDIKRTSVVSNSNSIGVGSARSPLPWQRRPRSQTMDRTKARPLSMVAAENAARNSPNLPEPVEQAVETASPAASEESFSRDQIAQSLAGKDPSWFRQTADPGRGSGAFRKSQVEDQDTTDVSAIRTQLPGMSRRMSMVEPVRESIRPESQTLPKLGLGSPLPILSAQRLDPPSGDGAADIETSPTNRHSIASPGRTSSTRPVSPTKGMGGFVQSAMMKRSDSVKRWSVNSPGGLQRADTVLLSPKASPRPQSMLSRENSAIPTSRPTSRHGTEEQEQDPEPEKKEEEAEAKPEPEAEPREEEIPAGAKTPTRTARAEFEDTSLPISPSKTMDPRRWSPTKSSSWLEAALNKPESPKAKPAAPSASTQPAWMLELNKAKAQKGGSVSGDIPRSPSFLKKTEVKTGGLMRSTPMGASLKPSALSAFTAAPPVGASEKPPVGGFRNTLRKASPTNETFEESAESKIKPEAPVKPDFRANLKHRSPELNKSSQPVDELKTVFGSLRRTRTQNYVPPDELKDNILRGKSGLNNTGGPKKSERKDEFKEAILKKKDDFRKSQIEGRGVSVTREPSNASDKSLPEGLAKSFEISRRATVSKPAPAPASAPTPDTPLATTNSNRSSYFSTNSSKPEASTPLASRFSPEVEKPPVLESITAAAAPKTLPGKIGSRVGGGGLADRFNPGLANLIARGPLAASGPAQSPESEGSGAAATEEPTKPGPQLTHITKNRARGPKRKAPTSVAQAVQSPEEKEAAASREAAKSPISPPPIEKPVTSPKPSRLAAAAEPEKPDVSAKTEKPVTSPKPERFATPKTDTASLLNRRKSVAEIISLVDSSKRYSKEESKPTGQPIALVGSPSVKTRPRSPTKVQEQAAALAALNQQAPRPAETESPSTPALVRTRSRSPTKVDERAAALAALAAKNEQKAEEPAASTPIRTRPRSTTVADQIAALAAKAQQESKVAAEEPAASTPGLVRTRSRSPTKVDERAAALAALSANSPQKEEEPAVSTPIRNRPRSTTKSIHDQVAALAAKAQEPAAAEEEVTPAAASPKKLDLKRMSVFLDQQQAPATPQPEPTKAPSPAKDRFNGLASPEPLLPRSASPSKDGFSGLASPSIGKHLIDDKPQLQAAASINRGLSQSSGVGLGLSQPESPIPPKPIRKDSPKVEQAPPRLPPKGARPLPEPPARQSIVSHPEPPRVTSPPPRVPSPLRSPSKHASDVSAMLTAFFGKERPTRRHYDTDAAEILMNRPVSTASIQTQRAQLFTLSPEGKRSPVPAHYERVLFEREMYICPHTFIDEYGRKVNEIYFWAGDEVPRTVVEDTYRFAAREARVFGGKLIALSQGKETSEFLQALGGIVIVRRGSSNKYDSLAPHILCGRRYLGQVAFDEVDFSPLSLCSGFPYLITQQGKCYLWKGKGSDIEELGCARLVGMDLALMGELLEVEEGYEPQNFWDIFGGGADANTRPISADHWRLKPNYDKYSGRLFVANADASEKSQIHEISPFSQMDLSSSNIYVLDAFFEIYIIVGGKSQSQYAAFHNALDFAQEYAILAAGMEDRPFVPVATVVLEGIPRDLKAVFRKWRDGNSPTRTVVPPTPEQLRQQQTEAELQLQKSNSVGSNKGSSGGLRRARSLKIVPLGLALRAVQE